MGRVYRRNIRLLDIDDKAGRIPGAVYGYAGTTDANSLEYFRNIDNTMRNFEEVVELWKEAGINMDKPSFIYVRKWMACS